MSERAGLSLLDGLVGRLRAWPALDAAEDELRHEYLELLQRAGVYALAKQAGPQHVTASCFVLTPDLTRVLLCLHGRGRFWVQLGGHVESGDASIEGAALREAREEGGLEALRLVPDLIDLDRHDLVGSFGSCRTHWDVGLLATGEEEPPRVSAESEQVSWFDVDRLPTPLASGVGRRIERMRLVARSRGGGAAVPSP